MNSICKFIGRTPLNNRMCLCCPLFLETCTPIASDDGYALGSECDRYLCSGCKVESCIYKDSTMLYGMKY